MTTRRERDLVFERFRAVVDSIPPGRVATYGEVAREAGLPRHARHVGAALRALPRGTALPWHRVLNAGGRVSERSGGGALLQRRRLEAEGVAFGPGGRVDLERYRWRPGDAPAGPAGRAPRFREGHGGHGRRGRTA